MAPPPASASITCVTSTSAEDDSGTATAEKESIVYARVSSAHQKADLARQIADLRREHPSHRLVSDVGSGLNFKRRGLLAVLERVLAGVVDEVVVMHRDRLARYGVELLEFVFKEAGTRLVVLGLDGTDESSETRELADDLLAITTVFVARAP